MRKLLTPIAALSLGLLATSAQAQLIASDSFNYAAGSGVIATEGTGGTGWGSGWVSKTDTTSAPVSQVMASSLGYTDGLGNVLTTSGGSLISATTTTTTGQPQRQLPGTIGALSGATTAAGSGTLWVSYLWQGLNTTGSGSGLYRQAIMMFINGATSAANGSGSERLDIGMPNISAVNQGTVNPNISLWTSGGISGGNGTISSTAPVQSSVAANNGSTDFILMKFTVDSVTTTADTVQVWINPNLTGLQPVTAANLTWSLQDLSAINGMRVQSGALNTTYGSIGGTQQVDEFNVGNTVADVEPVPEPSSFALAGLAGLALVALRRNRK